MKTKAYGGLMALSAAALLACVTSTPTLAQTAAAAGQAAAPARHARLDADGDRKISQAEFVQARTARLAALDADHDGTVNRAEIQARAQAVRAERATARFDRLDADRNGQISRAEFDAARPQRAEGARPGRGERAGAHHRGGQRMARHAGRGAGRGHGPAMQAARRAPASIADAQTRAAATFARLDADHDGFLTTQELRAGRHAGRPDRAARRMGRPMAPAATPASPPAPASE